MGITNFQIVFDSPTNAYYAGQNVTGKVNITLDKPKKIRALSIKFEGAAHVQWTEAESVRQNDGNTANENITYTGNEEYYSFKYNLAGGGNSELEIPEGQHSYPFSGTLPPTMPSSFEGEHGRVRYTVKATLDRPWKFDQHAEAVFTVVTPVDLNYNLKAKEPVKQEQEKTFCCCWCQSGPLQLVVALPCAGFVPGQSIPLTVEVDNASNIPVNNVVIKLNKNLKWKAHEPKVKEREDVVELSKLSLEGVDPSGSKSWTQMLPIPSMPPINLDQCTIINCYYNLTVTAAVSNFHSDLVADVPIFLGTVPIYQPSMENKPSDPVAITPSAPESPSIGFIGEPNAMPAGGGLYPTITTPLLPEGTNPVIPAQ